jgi:hypothetical protein
MVARISFLIQFYQITDDIRTDIFGLQFQGSHPIEITTRDIQQRLTTISFHRGGQSSSNLIGSIQPGTRTRNRFAISPDVSCVDLIENLRSLLVRQDELALEPLQVFPQRLQTRGRPFANCRHRKLPQKQSLASGQARETMIKSQPSLEAIKLASAFTSSVASAGAHANASEPHLKPAPTNECV